MASWRTTGAKGHLTVIKKLEAGSNHGAKSGKGWVAGQKMTYDVLEGAPLSPHTYPLPTSMLSPQVSSFHKVLPPYKHPFPTSILFPQAISPHKHPFPTSIPFPKGMLFPHESSSQKVSSYPLPRVVATPLIAWCPSPR